jgi:hypothetical protein
MYSNPCRRLTLTTHADPLLELDPPQHISPNRSAWRRMFHVRHYPRKILLPLMCLSICINAITTNGVYAWPQYGPIVVEKLDLTLAQGSQIVLGGICGTYLMAAPVGRLCDVKGPRL